MRLVLSWLRDFVDAKASAEQIADTLALRGFEVASIEPWPADELRPHLPNGVIDFEVTANRPDCLSVMGLAREVAAAFDVPFDPTPETSAAAVPSGESDRIQVGIEDHELGPRYVGAVADITRVDSPSWMTSRLQAAGVRPISPIVDITNYVLIERGHPMHAFDLATLAGAEIRVRRARPGEVITTLDNVQRKLDEEMLVIADRDRAQAVAGVMGGAASEVSSATKAVVFESAYFKPSSVRRTSKRLGLKTEASARFERGVDVNGAAAAMQRAIALMERIGAGRVSGSLVDRYPHPVGPRALHLRRARLALVLGMRVPDDEVERIMRALALQADRAPDGWSVIVPTFRVDLTREVDLIEEVGRHYGFDKLEASFPPMTVPAPPPDPQIVRDALIRRVLTGRGFSEAVTFGFIESKAAAAFAGPGDHVVARVANPLSAKFDVLRPSLVPGLVDAVAHNRRHGLRDVALFEIGSRFSPADGEHRGVAFAWTGFASREHWSGGAREVDFFDAKGVLEDLGAALGFEFRFTAASGPFLTLGQSADLLVGDSKVGLAGLVEPSISESRGAPRLEKIFVGELDLDRLWAMRQAPEERVRVLPRFPFVVRDVSIVVPDTLPAEIIRGTIQTAAANTSAPLVSIGFFDRYKGKGVADDRVSISVRLAFQASDRTLTDAEVQDSVRTIVGVLAAAHGAVQR